MSSAAVERCPWCGSAITHQKFVQMQAAIREDERRKLAAAEKQFKDQVAKQLELLKEQMDKQRRKELADVRRILDKDRETALLKKEAEFAREREALQKKIFEVSRKVKKSGGELADGIEIDVYDELRGAFSDDQITRMRGGELLHDVRYKGKSAGKILIDAKPRAAWQHAFVTKLRQLQSEVGADHAILATPVFPANRKELFVDSGVIVVAPARIRPMVEVLRKALVAMHVAKLTDSERSDKLNDLFKFITSAAFKKKLAEASELAAEALEIDVQEKRAHDLVWKKRGTVLTRIKNVLRDIDTDVTAIVEAPAPEPKPAPLRAVAFRVTR